jgi:hypothetical protein
MAGKDPLRRIEEPRTSLFAAFLSGQSGHFTDRNLNP